MLSIVTMQQTNQTILKIAVINCVSDMKIRALCPISGGNDSHKRHEMRLISKLVGTVDHLGIIFITLINALCLTRS